MNFGKAGSMTSQSLLGMCGTFYTGAVAALEVGSSRTWEARTWRDQWKRACVPQKVKQE